MKTEGTVLEIKKDYALVECERRSACASCEYAENCHEPCQKVKTRAINEVGAEVGDRVEVETDTSKFLSNAFYIFILPAVVCIASYFIIDASGVGSAVVWSAVLSVLSLAAAAFILERKAKHRVIGRIVSVISLKNESEI